MKILAWKLKKKIVENTITKIKHPETGNMMTNLRKIQEAFESFYKTLYAKVPGGAEYEIDNFLNSLYLPSLNEEQNKIMIAEVTETELMKAINKNKHVTGLRWLYRRVVSGI